MARRINSPIQDESEAVQRVEDMACGPELDTVVDFHKSGAQPEPPDPQQYSGGVQQLLRGGALNPRKNSGNLPAAMRITLNTRLPKVHPRAYYGRRPSTIRTVSHESDARSPHTFRTVPRRFGDAGEP